MATDRAEKKQKVKTEIRSMFLISLDGLDPTKEAAQSLEITHDNPCPVSDGNGRFSFLACIQMTPPTLSIIRLRPL